MFRQQYPMIVVLLLQKALACLVHFNQKLHIYTRREHRFVTHKSADLDIYSAISRNLKNTLSRAWKVQVISY